MDRKIEYAYLETTTHCNLKCSFCNREDVVKRANHMSLENWNILLEKIKDHPIKTAKLMGLGEPFLHPQFHIVLEKFKDRFPNCHVIVATNCQYSINENSSFSHKFQTSLKYIDTLYLSIDGYKESYEKYRSPAKWEKLINFLENLKQYDRHNCEIVVNYVVNTENIEDIQHIENLRNKYDLKKMRLNIAQTWSENSSIYSDSKISGYTTEQINYLKTHWKENIMGKSTWDYSDCFWVKSGIYTTVSGDVKICCMNTDTSPIGNIFTDDMNTIYNSQKFKSVKQGCATNCPESHCENCSYKELVPLLTELGVQND